MEQFYKNETMNLPAFDTNDRSIFFNRWQSLAWSVWWQSIDFGTNEITWRRVYVA